MNRGFAEQLLEEITRQKSAADEAVIAPLDTDNSSKELPVEIIKHWLNFAVYYEKAAVLFIGHWLQTTVEDDALVSFAHQIEDEANHYRWLKQHLKKYVDNYNTFQPPAEWRFLMEDYYPKLPTLIERLAAHNVAAETGVLGFMEFYFEKMPESIKDTMEKVIKDERFHVSFGMKLLNKYCHTDAEKQLARNAAYESLHYMQQARMAFVQI